GDEVILPPMTFAATANAVVFQGGQPIFADVDPDRLLLDPAQVEGRITSRTKAVVAVDYTGQPCDYDALRAVADRYNLIVIADACHSLGAEYRARRVGTLADLTVFSFHPVKHITTGEGGMVVTAHRELAEKMRRFRNHGMTLDHVERTAQGTWYYEIVDLGYNYRLSDLQCAMGISQLRKLPGWVSRRQAIARRYDAVFAQMAAVEPLGVSADVSHAYHLYVIKLRLDLLQARRATIFAALREQGIGVGVHYIPVHFHPFYRERFATGPGLCPVAEDAYERVVTLPIFPRMSESDVDAVIAAVCKVIEAYGR
ncbi:MAG: UDP-4-amino-4,6-dideoxy-N-acetyl-beta-L-altrosamine transaminase, partial [Anaerolineales bacterium]|nr:UDP-4-amino-4,6-dideoxy-N-acetyl-beta-L-altrosamine transaminase [Anaerolineales bacterium]